DFKEKTLIECDDCEEIFRGDASKKLGTSKEIIRFESYKPDKIVLDIENKNNSWLVFSNSFLPGWQAFIDGKEAKIYRANYLFQAIQVPAGNYKILFRYKIL
ncbi:MAG: YfhO family protein, partial [Patescibacteria group bacterium]